jgi:hypothetical protein
MPKIVILFLSLFFSFYSDAKFIQSRMVAAGVSSICALTDEGIHCWGDTSVSRPANPQDWMKNHPTQLSVGRYHTCALFSDSVRCSGYKTVGEISGRPAVPWPQDPLPFSNGTQIASGRYHNCVMNSDQIQCWGDNSFGELDMPPNLHHPRQISAGGTRTCALTDEGVTCWGGNKPFAIPYLNNPQSVATGAEHACAKTDDGVVCWGSNDYYQLNIPKGLSQVSELVAGRTFTCARSSEGIQCWGYFADTPPKELKNPRGLAAGWNYACAITDDGIKCWGDVGDVPTGLKNPTELNSSREGTVALTDEGIVSWGLVKEIPSRQWKNPKNIKLAGWNPCAIVEKKVKCFSDFETTYDVDDPDDYATAERGGVCILKAGQVRCFGPSNRISEVPADLVQVKKVAMNGEGDYACALLQDRVRCWGKIVTDLKIPGASAIFTGRETACALIPDGYQCWGYENDIVHGLHSPKQIVIGLYSGKCVLDAEGLTCDWSFSKVPSDLGIPDFVTGTYSHICAFTQGEIKCWGENDFGQTDVPVQLTR